MFNAGVMALGAFGVQVVSLRREAICLPTGTMETFPQSAAQARMSPPRPFRLVYRAFREVTFDPAKSDEIYELRGFDLAYVSRMFPGTVLERQDTRLYSERRYQAIGDVLGEVFFVVYTRRGDTCRLITGWVAEPHERKLWYDLTH
jgi:uncharacterized DUF497 family protein